ncbi:MAG: hypothetical protein B7733_12880, partial [Myxococcales bacterium FL481]
MRTPFALFSTVLLATVWAAPACDLEAFSQSATESDKSGDFDDFDPQASSTGEESEDDSSTGDSSTGDTPQDDPPEDDDEDDDDDDDD